MKQRENAGVAFGCEYRDGAITPVYQCFVGFSMGNTVSIRSIMYSSIIARLEVQLCFFFFFIYSRYGNSRQNWLNATAEWGVRLKEPVVAVVPPCCVGVGLCVCIAIYACTLYSLLEKIIHAFVGILLDEINHSLWMIVSICTPYRRIEHTGGMIGWPSASFT